MRCPHCQVFTHGICACRGAELPVDPARFTVAPTTRDAALFAEWDACDAAFETLRLALVAADDQAGLDALCEGLLMGAPDPATRDFTIPPNEVC